MKKLFWLQVGEVLFFVMAVVSACISALSFFALLWQSVWLATMPDYKIINADWWLEWGSLGLFILAGVLSHLFIKGYAKCTMKKNKYHITKDC